jgi:hypothetical protein
MSTLSLILIGVDIVYMPSCKVISGLTQRRLVHILLLPADFSVIRATGDVVYAHEFLGYYRQI